MRRVTVWLGGWTARAGAVGRAGFSDAGGAQSEPGCRSSTKSPLRPGFSLGHSSKGVCPSKWASHSEPFKKRSATRQLATREAPRRNASPRFGADRIGCWPTTGGCSPSQRTIQFAGSRKSPGHMSRGGQLPRATAPQQRAASSIRCGTFKDAKFKQIVQSSTAWAMGLAGRGCPDYAIPMRPAGGGGNAGTRSRTWPLKLTCDCSAVR